MNIVALVPARKGSKGLVGKNLRTVAGKPLLGYTLEAARASRMVSRVIFSTDSEKMAKIAATYGAEVPFVRPEPLASDTACMVDVMQHCVRWLQTNEGYRTDLLVTLYVTSPFRTAKQIDEAINRFLNSDADCLVSVSRQKHHPYWSLKIDENERLQHAFEQGKTLYRRQDMPATYEQNGAIYIVRPKDFHKLDRRSMAENTLPYVMDGPSGLNIDEEQDLVLAEALASEVSA
ncbi:MAG: acylneuraminate cytidylyltransferase family protein [Deltaproteobacteria bacterium]|nr:acylneuraminate cytidylyltransferase family protein [Deltaproteobacteria bacterium]